jgi:hypothetical protein
MAMTWKARVMLNERMSEEYLCKGDSQQQRRLVGEDDETEGKVERSGLGLGEGARGDFEPHAHASRRRWKY